MFDTYRNPKLLLQGELHRLFQAEKVIKVIHDSKDYCAQLHEDYNVTFHAVFDTQVAYTLEMEEKGLPPRLISYQDMYRNIVGTEQSCFFFAMKVMLVLYIYKSICVSRNHKILSSSMSTMMVHTSIF